ncbi:hypothetical protein Tco_0328988 [Tanacetum coccineum]
MKKVSRGKVLEDDVEKAKLQLCLEIVPRDDEAINVESLATKYSIVDWKTHILTEDKMYYEIIRADGSTKFYKIFTTMLDDFDRQDVLDLYRLIKERFETTSPEGYDRLLWGGLITLFEPKAAKFVQDFKYLAKEADESLAKYKALELEIERLLRAVIGQDIMSIVQNPFVVDSSNLQIELERTKEQFENCIIKKENEYIERLQAQLGDQKGRSKDTPCVSNTLDPLSQKLENENIEIEFHVLNYAKENAHLKTTYKNMFDSISVSEQKDTTKGTSTNTKFANQSTERKPSLQPVRKNFVVRQPNALQSDHTTSSKNRVPQKVDETNDLSKPVTSSSSHSNGNYNNSRHSTDTNKFILSSYKLSKFFTGC